MLTICFRITSDISQSDGIRTVLSEIIRLEPNGINILVNNGNVSPEERARSEAHAVDFSDATAVSKWMAADGPDAWKDAWSGNIASHNFLTAALLPLLDKGRQQTPGHSSAIINIASVAGLTKTHSHGQFAFSSTKAAFIHLTKEWAHTFLPLRVRVNCIALGIFPLVFPGEGVRDEGQRERLERVGHEIPAGQFSYTRDQCHNITNWLLQDDRERKLTLELRSCIFVARQAPT